MLSEVTHEKIHSVEETTKIFVSYKKASRNNQIKKDYYHAEERAEMAKQGKRTPTR
jgi:hypothetical protein